ncbi:NAD(P)-binding protein [Dissoconium aciculare CBS 342.82]|uniref:NAD(P)-binding protein n=1 Tax=Dissoconium aciculare CBS 342.82 TaxID=1314786 RepID=A0A6J3LVI3_9PEZI|nr:NAD(P)-binding protein [Dissoconium aciculare CBS 342.82]KAF1819299.1 NAD(P)-binding protein [Dissoconium aciculare CBS 342.82]
MCTPPADSYFPAVTLRPPMLVMKLLPSRASRHHQPLTKRVAGAEAARHSLQVAVAKSRGCLKHHDKQAYNHEMVMYERVNDDRQTTDISNHAISYLSQPTENHPHHRRQQRYICHHIPTQEKRNKRANPLIENTSPGIGRGLLSTYLLRANHTLIGTIRPSTSTDHISTLHSLPLGPGSKLILLSLDSADPSDPSKAIQELQCTHNITHLDMVIANAAIAPDPAPLEVIAPGDLTDAYRVNVVAPVLLYQASKPLLENAPGQSQAMWVTISSVAGSVSKIEEFPVTSLLAYSASKAAANWFTVAVHAANPSWIATAIQPGFVATDMGIEGCKRLGLPPPPDSIEKSIAKTVAFLDRATRENASGKLYDVIAEAELPF